ncbi:MAG: hypothetical protein A3C07_02095 [Candidatus Sungbacteria bacterium RIFCSPHIGHO2_02_FULL_47_11]|uniref:Heat-inducible transcription repressor HrcA n=1 Tax=Candidatus Sungbacteria bacterium RIFCSPHIGHO2_02_FULL_47_11 TaxID=1802270 RepID=A0A1G2KN46_9BACT|nr:MAG: hypothetical protein A3C07_02095 [Candidatus Sungbacteria bacterium RIFCSPHIGHO2_02_FULL_47_11]
MLKERQKSILEAVIREHIRTARPVASQELVGRYHLNVSPATVRNDMVELDELGYLEQPHTSAGRVPTDQGYRFFVDEIGVSRKILGREQALFDALFAEDEEDFFSTVAKAVAHVSRGFTMVGSQKHTAFYKAGFSDVLTEPEFNDVACARRFGELVDSIDESFAELLSDVDFDEPHAFIGHENPIQDARSYSMIVSSLQSPHSDETVVAILGPKRMNYHKNISVVNYLQEYGRSSNRNRKTK